MFSKNFVEVKRFYEASKGEGDEKYEMGRKMFVRKTFAFSFRRETQHSLANLLRLFAKIFFSQKAKFPGEHNIKFLGERFRRECKTI